MEDQNKTLGETIDKLVRNALWPSYKVELTKAQEEMRLKIMNGAANFSLKIH
jgi:hypothetical protein